MTGHFHQWQIHKSEEKYISVGHCCCGAIRYFGDYYDKTLLARVNELNAPLGWQPMKFGHYRSVEESPPERKKEEREMISEEGSGNQGGSSSAAMERPPVPPRPQGGAGAGAGNKAVKQYYQDNKYAILKDLAELGEKKMLERWNISGSTWRQKKGLAERWGVDISRRAKKGAQDARTDDKNAPKKQGDGQLQETRTFSIEEIARSFPSAPPSRPTIAEREKHKDEMIADYNKMKIVDFLKKWHIDGKGWKKLKKLWKVKGKAAGGVRKPAVQPLKPATDLSESEMAARCMKCNELKSANGRMVCKLEACRFGYKLKASASGSTTEAPAIETKPADIEIKANHAATPPGPAATPDEGGPAMPRGVRVVIIPLPPSPNALPPMPEFDSQWPQDVKLEWMRTYRELALGAAR